jgi:cysteine dioxygenase
MSTPNTHAATSRQTSSGDAQARFSLESLVGEIASLRRMPGLAQLDAWLREADIERTELRPYVGFKEGTYARHRVFINEFAELLVLCWRPGQRTPIHDHNGSYGSVRVLEGVMWETVFTLEGERGLVYERARQWSPGFVTGADVPDIHQLGNPDVSGQDLITLHLYSPPLTSLNIYHVGQRESINTLCMNSWNPTI